MTKIFIDGSAGTTGLRLLDRLKSRKELSILELPESLRKDTEARADKMNAADIVFLCLPDAAAIEAVPLIKNSHTAVIDTSTAHRTNEEWTYGFPELTGHRDRIRSAKRIANPGCHASGAIALLYPLVENHLISADLPLSCFSLTGYSGGGKKMIAEYMEENRDPLLDAPRLYGLTQNHKHLPEIIKVCGLKTAPIFCPIVAPYYAGMEVMIPLHTSQVSGDIHQIKEAYKAFYQDGMIHYMDSVDESGFLSAGAYAQRDDMQITVTGNEERIVLTARFDNLGKGASGAAIQNMNLLIGVPENTGLNG